MKRPLGRYGMVASILVLGSFLPTVNASAAGSCSTWTYYQFGAYMGGSNNASGSLADIQVRPSDLCSNSGAHSSLSASWSMLSSGTSDQYAQIGWTRTKGRNGGAASYFYQYVGAAGNPHTDWWGNPSNGDEKRFKTTWLNGSGEDNDIHLFLCDSGGGNCVDKQDTGISPGGWNGIYGLAKGEVNNRQSDMPGTDGARDNFENLEQRIGTGAWSAHSLTKCDFDCPIGTNDNPDRFHFEWATGNDFRIWTDPL
jgi:hypothetical protein